MCDYILFVCGGFVETGGVFLLYPCEMFEAVFSMILRVDNFVDLADCVRGLF